MDDMGGIAPLLGYIEDAIGQYVSRRTIEERRAEEVLDDLIGFISSGECSVPLQMCIRDSWILFHRFTAVSIFK